MRIASRFLALVFIALIVILPIKADNGVWKFHSVFNEKRTQLIDTNDKVYFVTDNSLNAFNKKTKKFESLTINDRLSSYYVNNIYYNAKKNYIVVTYKDYNIDVLLKDGSTINIADLKNLKIAGEKTINDVNFGKEGFYVASDIGYLYIEDTNFSIKKAAYLNEKIKSVAEIGDKIFISANSNVFYADNKKNIKSLSQMTSSALNITGKIMPINENKFFINSNLLYLVTIGEDNSMIKKSISSAKVIDIQNSKDGFIALGGSSATATNKLYTFDADANKTLDITLPIELKGMLISSQEKDGVMWRLSDKGIRKFTIDASDATVKNKSEEYIPNNIVNISRAIAMSYNKNNNKVYVTNGCPRNNLTVQKYGVNAQISSYDGKSWKNEVPFDLKGYRFKDPTQLEFDINDAETYYAGTWYEGVYKVKNNEIVGKYDWTNSTLVHALNNWFCYTPCVQFDNKGNLWVLQSTGGYINMLPKEHIEKSFTELNANDWKSYDLNLGMPKSVEFFITKKGYKILYDGDYLGKLHIFTTDENNEISSYKSFDYLYDQDGKKIDWSYIHDIKEDLNGIVWLATYSGIYGIIPEEFENNNFRAICPKDKDYGYKIIMDNIVTMSIEIDEYNRKWVGTLDGGLYMLNADCSKILNHFDSSNACFPNNNVLALCWSPASQSILVGLNGGLLEYFPENGNDISNTFMIPNRITPDFKGNITFDKVPIKSTLYIKNSNGDVLKTINGKKSKVYWNGVDDKNNSLETGVYTVSIKLNGSDVILDNLLKFSVIK